MGEGGRGQGVGGEEADLGGFRASLECATGDAAAQDDEDDRVAGAREDAEESLESDFDAGFLTHLADGGGADLLAAIDKAAGQGPGAHGGLMVAAGVEQVAVGVLDEDADGDFGVLVVDEVAGGAGEAEGALGLAGDEGGGAEGAEAGGEVGQARPPIRPAAGAAGVEARRGG